LFQPFVQVDSRLTRQHEGTGLGLALVQKLTDLHGGSVHVESAIGTGSRFTINIPYRKEEIARLLNQPLSSDSPTVKPVGNIEYASAKSISRGTILLAEDNLPNILTIGEYFESHGY
jgi:Histidine kinase-, DNA gyrase B-, and HSP90-like ATPase